MESALGITVSVLTIALLTGLGSAAWAGLIQPSSPEQRGSLLNHFAALPTMAVASDCIFIAILLSILGAPAIFFFVFISAGFVAFCLGVAIVFAGMPTPLVAPPARPWPGLSAARRS